MSSCAGEAIVESVETKSDTKSELAFKFPFFLSFFHHHTSSSYLNIFTKTINTAIMVLLKGLVKVVAPEIENTEEALTQSLASLTWVDRSRRVPAEPRSRPAAPVQTELPRRVESPPPPIPERNPTRPNYALRIQQEHQLEVARRIQDNPALSHQQARGIPQHQPEHRRRANSPTDAEVSKYLRKTRPGQQRRELSPQAHRGNPTVQEEASRRDFPAHHQELHHPQPRRPSPDMAAMRRRTSYLEVAAATNQHLTPHQLFLKGQVQRQQDATDEWARRTGKPAPPYKFETFIGKGAYGRVFKA